MCVHSKGNRVLISLFGALSRSGVERSNGWMDRNSPTRFLVTTVH